jgi:hypothetical protein
MIRSLAAVFVLSLLLLASSASAAVTWSAPSVASDYGLARASAAACSTGTEATPTDGAGTPAQGVDLVGTTSVSIHLECAGAVTAGTLVGYAMNPITGKWNPVAGLTKTTTTAQYQAWTDVQIVGGISRVAWLPSGLGAVACTVYHVASVVRR